MADQRGQRKKLSGAEYAERLQQQRLKRMEGFAARQSARDAKREKHKTACLRFIRKEIAPSKSESLAHWEAVWQKLIDRGVVWSDEEWREHIAQSKGEKRKGSSLAAPMESAIPARPKTAAATA